MKPSALQWLSCLGMLVAALGAAGWLQADSIPELPVEPAGPVVTINPARLLPGTVQIQFRFHDFAGSLHRFNCSVDESFVRREEGSFGFPLDQEAIFKELDRRLAEEVAKKAGPLGSYATIEVSHESVDQGVPRGLILWKYRLGERRWSDDLPGKEKLPSHLRKDALRVEDWIAKDLPGVSRRILREYYKERGFDFDLPPDGGVANFAVAYKDIADKARPILADCFDKLVRESGAADDEEILSLLLAAMQEMQFQFPRVEEGDLYKAGFWIPTQVLRLKRGDCDSKSGAFCGLWQRASPQILLLVIDVPEEVKQRLPPEMRADQHAFLAIEALPGLNDQESLTRGLRKYVPYEVVRRIEPGLTKVHPGEQLLDGVLRWEVCMTDDCFGTRK
jgi:hypothetical protein